MCCSVLDVYMSVKSQHLRLVDDVSEFHHTVWRSGQSLVVKKDSVLPDCCVKCGAPAQGSNCQQMACFGTHRFCCRVALLSCYHFICCLAIGMRKTMTVSMPLCSKHLGSSDMVDGFWGCTPSYGGDHRFDSADAIHSRC